MMNWSDIDTVLLDMDGTLLDLHFDNYFWLQHLPQQYALKKDITFEQALEKVKTISESLYGSLKWYCLDHWSQELEVDIEKLKHGIRHMIQLRPYSLEFLAFLNDMNKQLLLVTNAHPKALELKIASSGLHHYIQKFISSHEFNLAKENTGFWAQFAQREKVDLSRALFIDDSVDVLKCAQQEGVAYTMQILQPDSSLEPKIAGQFPGIIHLNELMATAE